MLRARRATAATVTVGAMRVPPLPTPRAVLSMTSTPFIPVRRCETTTTFSGPHSSTRSSASVISVSLHAAPVPQGQFQLAIHPAAPSSSVAFPPSRDRALVPRATRLTLFSSKAQICLPSCAPDAEEHAVLRVHLLATLQAVHRTGSFALAARELGYTPSAVSQQIAALEKDTGLVLFEREARAVRATAAAHRLAELS